MTTYLITGVTGQDGVLLARLLRRLGHRVIGTSRTGTGGRLACYLDGVDIVAHDVRDHEGFARLMSRHRPDVVVNLAAQSSVAASWEDPATAREVNGAAVTRLLEAVRRLGEAAPRFIQASTVEIFGPPSGTADLTDHQAALNPMSPYAEGKAVAHLAVAAARDEGLRATNLILFGHTSCLQSDQFVLPLVTRQAAELSRGLRSEIRLRDPDVRRDWCSASDVARAFVRSADGPPGDYVIASGELCSLRQVSQWALEAAAARGAVVATEPKTSRPHDSGGRVGDVRLAQRELGWRTAVGLRDVVHRMVEVDLTRVRTGVAEDPAFLR